jgi:hypothetical protein
MMSREFLLKTAEALEKLAEHLDHEEVQREETARAERLKVARDLGEKVANITGESLPDDVLEKIASSDHGVVEAFAKLAERHAEAPPDGLGESSDIRDGDSAAPTSKAEQVKEASAQADDHFLNWIMS